MNINSLLSPPKALGVKTMLASTAMHSDGQCGPAISLPKQVINQQAHYNLG